MSYRIVAPRGGSFDAVLARGTLPAFDDATTEFLDAFSRHLLNDPACRAHAEIVALGFWARRARIARLASDFAARSAGSTWLARGLAFHIAPANVDTVFLYSWFVSMLCGNRNVVRISSRDSRQVALALEALDAILSRPGFEPLRERNLVVRYEHDEDVTAEFSRHCDLRIVWGGNETVNAIRRVPIPPTALDVAFADKFSLALINAARWREQGDDAALGQVEQFFNDAYWFGQMACSSPRLVLWHGTPEDTAAARRHFWTLLGGVVARRAPHLAEVDYVNKLASAYATAIDEPVHIEPADGNEIVRVVFGEDASLPFARHCGGGLFWERRIDALEALLPIVDRHIQTVIYYGYEPAELRRFVASTRPAGIDRFVPFGKALEFAVTWDGFDLFRTLMREVTVL